MFEPQNEQGVIVLFAQQTKGTGIEIVEIQTHFPDAIIYFSNRFYRVEFEYHASSFNAHSHDVGECDVIVCWENNLRDFVLPVWEMSRDGWLDTAIFDLQNKRVNAYEAYLEQKANSVELTTISFVGTKELRDLLIQWANEDDRTMSAVIRRILEKEAKCRGKQEKKSGFQDL